MTVTQKIPCSSMEAVSGNFIILWKKQSHKNSKIENKFTGTSEKLLQECGEIFL